MYFGNAWNAFEGCTVAAGKYYAMGLTEKLTGTDDYDVLIKLEPPQHWVRTDVNPSSGVSWRVLEILESVPLP